MLSRPNDFAVSDALVDLTIESDDEIEVLIDLTNLESAAIDLTGTADSDCGNGTINLASSSDDDSDMVEIRKVLLNRQQKRLHRRIRHSNVL
jgi:hypothetical protein